MDSVCKAISLSKNFGAVKAIDDFSLTLSKGEILGLLGPNGAGKTTIIQILLGVLTPDSGDVEFFGSSLFKDKSTALEKVNFSSSYTNLPWNLRVKDNLHFISYLYDITNRRQRLDELTEEFKLGSLLDKRVILLSAGELSRLNLAKAFINEPAVVLLDEPTASLDPESVIFVHDYILRQRREKGLSVLFTSHNMREVEKLCDRVMFIDHGKLVADDEPQKLAQRFNYCSLQLIVPGDLHPAFQALCDKFNLQGEFEGEKYTCSLLEDNCPVFLRELMANSIYFKNITVTPPSLEDFFLSQVRRKSADTSAE